MIDKSFWMAVAEHWIKESDGIDIPDDAEEEKKKAQGIVNNDDDISDDELDDILSDFNFDDD